MAKAALFRLFKSKELARPMASPVREKIVLEAEVMAGDGHAEKVAIDPMTDVAVLQYTGGTTGTPKGAMLTHANCYVNAQQVAAWRPDLGYGTERVLGVLPFFHVFALTVVMNVAIARAAEIIIMPRFSLDEASEADRPDAADDHAVRADAAQRHHEPPEDQELRSVVAAILPVGRRGAARSR